MTEKTKHDLQPMLKGAGLKNNLLFPELPIPGHFNHQSVGQVWRVPYEKRAELALAWSRQYQIPPVATDNFHLSLYLVDVQNTFCIPDFELFVGGRSGTGAVDDNRRMCEFIYRNLGRISDITATLDTHLVMQIFHPHFFIDDQGNHPNPYTTISSDDIRQGHWRFNPAVAGSTGIDPEYGHQYIQHYTRQLQEIGKYELTVWPYHALLGGIGHALVPAVEEALFFHTISRSSQPDYYIKGNNPLTEHYSAVGPEVLFDQHGEQIGQRNDALIQKVKTSDAVVVAGQAKSHCVAWTVEDLLQGIRSLDESLAEKVYLLDDCSSPVVVPGTVDYTDEAEAAYQRFAAAGMHVVRSSQPIDQWPGMAAKLAG